MLPAAARHRGPGRLGNQRQPGAILPERLLVERTRKYIDDFLEDPKKVSAGWLFLDCGGRQNSGYAANPALCPTSPGQPQTTISD